MAGSGVSGQSQAATACTHEGRRGAAVPLSFGDVKRGEEGESLEAAVAGDLGGTGVSLKACSALSRASLSGEGQWRGSSVLRTDEGGLSGDHPLQSAGLACTGLGRPYRLL